MEIYESKIKEDIENAIKAGEPIKIKYNGGSQPGRIREIIPTKLSDNKVYAFCVTSGAHKLFIIDKIELIEETTAAIEYDPDFVPEPEFKESDGLQPIYDKFINTWIEYGWHVEIDKNGIYLFRKWKNGKPLKYASVSIKFEEVFYPRPWCGGGIYYKYFEKAVNRFIECSKTESPIAGRK